MENYPVHYRGWIPFNESRKVFSNSKINLSTHVAPDGYKYLNERVTQILGSGGLLLVDKVNGIEEIFKNEECVIIDENNYVNQIKHILFNYSEYEKMRIRGLEKAKKDLSWNSWAQTIVEGIK
jgi:spore maturation protein CgeB